MEDGCNKASTSKPQTWHKPHSKGKRVHEPDFVKNLQVKKIKGSFDSNIQNGDMERSHSRVAYDPRALCHQNVKQLSDFNLEKLQEITSGNCGVLLYSVKNSVPNAKEDVPTYIYSDISAEDHIEVVSFNLPNPIPFISEQIKGDLNLHNFSKRLLQEIQVTPSEVEHLAASTTEQSKCSLWLAHHKARITGSTVHEAISKVGKEGNISKRNDSFIAKTMGYTDRASSQALTFGLSREELALETYASIQKLHHADFQLKKSGLILSVDHPYIGASPDGIVRCSCHGPGVVEVKNPFTNRSLTIHELATSNKCSILQYRLPVVDNDMQEIILNRKHQYFTQIQCQMYVTNTSYCDFVVQTCADYDNIYIERVKIDHDFVSKMVNKCKIIFDKLIVPELYSPVVEHTYNVKLVVKILDQLLQKVLPLDISD